MTTTPQSAEAQEREALMPCPFCGASASGHALEPHTHSLVLNGEKLPDYDGGYVIEGDCACGSGLIGESREEVAGRWNRRASLPSAAASGAATVKDSLHVAPTPAVEGLTAQQLLDVWKKETGRMHLTGSETADLFQLINSALAASPVPVASSAPAVPAVGAPVARVGFDATKILILADDLQPGEPLFRQSPAASAEGVTDEQIDAAFMAWNANCHGAPMEAHRRFARSILALAPAASLREQEDTARLDWLDATNARFRMGWEVGVAPVGNVSVKSVIFAGAKPPTPIREAIDAQRLGREKE